MNIPRQSGEWDARAYHAVSEPQFGWGKGVLATLPLDGGEHVLDAGCGTGRLTALVAERVPRGYVVGMDRSVNMARLARETLARCGNATVAVADLAELPFPSAFDVIFSTATFHWVRDHDRLFSNVFAALRPDGRLHAQCGGGRNLRRIHERVHEIMGRRAFARFFRDWIEPWEFASAETTRQRLERAGFQDVRTSIEDAPITFANADDYRAFVIPVVLRPFLEHLPDDHVHSTFVDAVVAGAAADSPPLTLDYQRLNMTARR